MSATGVLSLQPEVLEAQVGIEQVPAFRFTQRRLDRLAAQHAEAFRSNQPFPHLVIQDFLPDAIARALAAEFPGPADAGWHIAGPGDVTHSGDRDIEKLGNPNEESFPPLTRHVMHEFNSATFLRFLEALTGYPGLIPDPSFFGGGLHSTGRGGRLMVHADASRHPNPKLHQILNAIYYVTPDWDEAWGGQLELWDRDLKGCVTSVWPRFNSLMIFFTGSRSYHGHPHPLQSPPGTRRNSLATYYYTTDRNIDRDYRGYRNYVDWVRTTELDKRVSPFHMAKAAARRSLPAPVVNGLARIVRSARK